MELIRGLHNMRPRHRGCVVTIGAFDGVHLGHQAVIRHLLDKSLELAVPSLVIVFEPFYENYGPDAILCEAKPVFVTLEAPDYRLEKAMLDAVVTSKTRAMSPAVQQSKNAG